MKCIPSSDYYGAGELFARALLNFDRLEEPRWYPDKVFQDPNYAWPGDMEGRTILALTLLAQATHRKPRYLDAIMEALPSYLNGQGFFGEVHSDDADEQQLSSHGWVLRGLCEYYRWKQEPATLAQIRAIVEHLAIPVVDFYDAYPTVPEQRRMVAGHMGEIQNEKLGAWYSSTDIGCAFIFLDGVVQAYEVLGEPRLKPVIDKMIEVYLTLDFVGLSCQTHATLTGIRGLLRYYALEGDAYLLAEAQRIWDLYLTRGMSENYSNHNWFGRPQLTEGCAVVDAFMVAADLWRLTGEERHLNLAHDILYNALYHGQRSNGGFGCDTCVSAATPVLAVDEIYEAWWCCTMRGAEGLKSAMENAYYTDGDTITAPFYHSSTARCALASGTVELIQRTRYPRHGDIALEVLSSSVDSPVTLRLFVPEWVDRERIHFACDGQSLPLQWDGSFLIAELPLLAGRCLRLHLPVSLRVEPVLDPAVRDTHHTFRHGPLILGCAAEESPVALARDAQLEFLGDAHYLAPGTGHILAPACDAMEQPEIMAKEERLQVVFGA